MPGFQTRAIHAGEIDPVLGAVTLPTFSSATYEFAGETRYDDLRYIRLNNTPNHRVLHAKLADLEGAEAALVTGSGMSAITTALLSVLKAGDHLLAQRMLYGGTHSFVTRDLERWGIEHDLIDAGDPDSWKAKLRPNTRAVYVESLTNPLVTIGALDQVAPFAREHGLVSLIDSTFATPVNFRPIEHGFDLVLHSATKYLNGHGDIVAGAVIGATEHVDAITHDLNHLGGSLNPQACALLHRGLRTLGLRMRQHDANGLAVARFLEEHPAVERVHYPGLESHPDHARAKAWFSGCGGVLSFELRGGVEVADQVLKHVRLPAVAPSLGSVESLITRPATTSHSGIDPELRRELGVPDELIRVACGVEDAEDLVADFEQAIAKATGA